MSDTTDITFVCVNRDDQIVIEGANDRTHAILLAIKEGWYRATEKDLYCPSCGKNQVEQAVKSTR